MASHFFNYAKQQLANGGIDLNSDPIYAILCMTNTTADTENDGISYVADLTTLDEADGSAYVRKELSSLAVNLDDANDRAEFDADDLTYTALGAGTRTVAGILIYKDADDDGASADDAANPVIAWIETTFTPDGSDVTVQWNAEGILQFT